MPIPDIGCFSLERESSSVARSFVRRLILFQKYSNLSRENWMMNFLEIDYLGRSTDASEGGSGGC